MSNREAWLTELAGQVRYLFKGFKMGEYRLTCGWPSARALGKGAIRIGECVYPTQQDGFHEIFISPLIDDSLEVAGVTVHEMAHIAAGSKAGHGSFYNLVRKHVGLTKGKPTQAAPGPALNLTLSKIIETMGKYPHQAIKPMEKKVLKAKVSVTLECANCGCKVSISLKWADKSGLPTCGCGNPLLPPEEDNG